MSVGAFITKTRPEQRGDTYEQCLQSAMGFCDRVVTIDGEHTWPQEFNWKIIGEHFQKGYENCEADWVFHLDTDFIFHEKDYDKLREVLEQNNEAPALSFWKYKHTLPDRYNLKSRLVIAVNKGVYGNRIRFDSGGDLCQPSLDGKEISANDVPEARIPFYNYDFLIKTQEQIIDDIGRMDRAYHRHFGKWLYSKDGTEESAYGGWLNMVLGRLKKPQSHVALSSHPKVMQEVIKGLTPNNFGYSIFDNLDPCSYFVNSDII